MSFESIDRKLTAQPGNPIWELYHENSKLSRYERHSMFSLPPSDAEIIRRMNHLHSVKPYRDQPKVALPRTTPASMTTFDDVLTGRQTARDFGTESMNLDQLAKLLYMGYGVTRDNADTPYPRPFRTVPSGGALYPLEIYLHASRVSGLEPGLFHYNSEANNLDKLRNGDETESWTKCFFQPELVARAGVILLLSAVFIRSTFKYGDRGYRFALIEAGHVAQNLILTVAELGLAAAPIGGYLDREIDRKLGLDGIEESVVYIVLIGSQPG